MTMRTLMRQTLQSSKSDKAPRDLDDLENKLLFFFPQMKPQVSFLYRQQWVISSYFNGNLLKLQHFFVSYCHF